MPKPKVETPPRHKPPKLLSDPCDHIDCADLRSKLEYCYGLLLLHKEALYQRFKARLLAEIPLSAGGAITVMPPREAPQGLSKRRVASHSLYEIATGQVD
jgi:hypothetical protein